MDAHMEPQQTCCAGIKTGIEPGTLGSTVRTNVRMLSRLSYFGRYKWSGLRKADMNSDIPLETAVIFFSAPEPKAQVHYCDHVLSVVRPSSVVVNFSHIRLLLLNRWTEFHETWQETRSQRHLPSLCFSGRSKKTRWPPWPLIGWDIFDFSSETAKRNSMKLDRKQDLNILYQVCVFQADRKNKMAALTSDRLRHFWLLLWNRWTEIQPNLTGSKIPTSSTKLMFFGTIRKTRWPPLPLIGWDIFRLFLWNR